MKISYNQLKNYITYLPEIEELSVILTDIGLEVGGIEEFQSIKGGLEGLVIGEVKTCEQHQNADKLSVTTVDVGGGNLLPIVCGAPNVAAGQKVVVATVGTILYDGDESFKIKKSKIRGELSEGMICAEDELGLGTSHDGIIVLPADVEVGTPAKDYYKIESDYTIEIDLTPNRNDAVSHYGVARDLAAYFTHKGIDFELTKPDVSDFKVDNNNLHIPVEIENTDACKRYSGITVSGITVKDSPEWLQNRLKAIGLQPINNVVDVTNFVLYELGQPLHAFDADKITGNKVIVKTLAKDTPFVTLDEVERKLTDKDLMICNTEEPMCIAGVFGGAKSGVSENTKNIFLESAYFDAVYVRKTSKYHALQTDASFRFERGTDPNITVFALKRAALLIKELAGGEISSEIVDVYPEAIPNHKIEVKYAHIDRLIGEQIGKETIKNIIQALDNEIVSEDGDILKIEVPPYRADVTREADMIEEILRIYGFNNIHTPLQVRSTLSNAPKPDEHKLRNRVSEFLSAQGFAEAMSNSLTKAGYYENGETYKAEESVKILNPLSNDLNVLRQTLLFNALEATSRNINYRNTDVQIYEFGHTYKHTGNENETLAGYHEEHHLALLISGNQTAVNWNSPEKESDFYFLKMQVQKLLHLLNFDIEQLTVSETEADIFNYGLSYALKGKTLVEFGAVSNKYLAQFDIEQAVFYADFNWDMILKTMNLEIRYQEIPKYPRVKRDLALLLDDNISFAQIEKIAYKTEKKLLKNVTVFDVFKDKKLGEGKKSYAVSFIIQDDSKTLKDKQIDKIMNKLTMNFKRELGAELR